MNDDNWHRHQPAKVQRISSQWTSATANKAIGDSRLRPRVRNLAASPGESRWIIRYVADSKPVSVFGPSCENMTSSTKPEIHNALQCCHRRTEPRPQTTCTENVVKFGHVAFEICERTDRQTDRQTDRYTEKRIAIYTSHPSPLQRAK